MLNVLVLLISLVVGSLGPADVIGGGGPGVLPTPPPTVSPYDVIGGGGPGVKPSPTPAPLDVIGGGGPD